MDNAMETQINRIAVKRIATGEVVGFHENVAFTFQGQTFEAGGAHVDPQFACGYPEFDQEHIDAQGVLLAADGSALGPCFIISRWATPRSWLSSHMCQIEALIDSVWYTGRGGGSRLLWRGKRKRVQRKRSSQLPHWWPADWKVGEVSKQRLRS